MVIAIIAGYTLGALLAFFLSKRLLQTVAERFASRKEQKQFIKVTGGVLGTIALAPAIFLAVIAGGYLEMYFSDAAEAYSALGQAGRLLVWALGLTIVTVVTVLTATAMGAAMGVVASRSLFPDRSNPT